METFVEGMRSTVNFFRPVLDNKNDSRLTPAEKAHLARIVGDWELVVNAYDKLTGKKGA